MTLCQNNNNNNKNIVAKGYNAGHQNLSPWTRFRFYLLTLSETSPVFSCLQYKPFENTVGKEEIACNENFLPFSSNLNLLSATSFRLEESKICHLGKG